MARFEQYDELISTIPLDKLCNDMLNGESAHLRDIKKQKRRRRFGIHLRLHGRHRHQAALPQHQKLDVFPGEQLPLLPRHFYLEQLFAST